MLYIILGIIAIIVIYGITTYNLGSRFLDEVPGSLIDEIELNDFEEYTPVPVFNLNEKISHKMWGPGIIVDILGSGLDQELIIDFGENIGTKHLILRYAPIVRL